MGRLATANGGPPVGQRDPKREDFGDSSIGRFYDDSFPSNSPHRIVTDNRCVPNRLSPLHVGDSSNGRINEKPEEGAETDTDVRGSAAANPCPIRIWVRDGVLYYKPLR